MSKEFHQRFAAREKAEIEDRFDGQVDNLQAQIDALEARIEALEAYHQ